MLYTPSFGFFGKKLKKLYFVREILQVSKILEHFENFGKLRVIISKLRGKL